MFGIKKYRLLNKHTFTLPSGKKVNLHQIEALIDIPLHGVKKGDLGGYVSSKRILSHKGSAWVGESAIVHNISDRELIRDDAIVKGNAVVIEEVSGTSRVYGKVYSSMKIRGNCDISGSAILESEEFEIGLLSGNVFIKDSVKIDNVRIESEGSSVITISDDVKIDTSSSRNLFRHSSLRAEHGEKFILVAS